MVVNQNKILIEQICNTKCTESTLSFLKEEFKEVIDSVRTFERLEKVADLMKVLDKRDSLSENELRIIANALNRPDLFYLISNYNIPVELSNEDVIQNISANHSGTSNNNQHSVSYSTDDKRIILNEIYTEIAESMGRKWKEFARRIPGMKEGKIDDLCRNNSMFESIIAVLRFHQDYSDPNCWRINLLRALEGCKRNDIRNSVEKRLDQYEIIKPIF